MPIPSGSDGALAEQDHRDLDERATNLPARVSPAADSRPGGGFFLIAAVVGALAFTAVVGLKVAIDRPSEGTHGLIPTGSAQSAAPAYTPAHVPATAGDVDGDGIPDKATVVPGPRASGGGAYDLVLEVHATRAGLLQLDLGPVQQALGGMHPVDVNNDGFADIPINVKVKGIQSRDELVTLTDGGLSMVRVDGATPLMLPVGTQGSTESSWDCVNSGGIPGHPGLVEEAVLSSHAGTWSLDVTDYQITGSIAEQASHSRTTVSHAAGKAKVATLHRCGAADG